MTDVSKMKKERKIHSEERKMALKNEVKALEVHIKSLEPWIKREQLKELRGGKYSAEEFAIKPLQLDKYPVKVIPSEAARLTGYPMERIRTSLEFIISSQWIKFYDDDGKPQRQAIEREIKNQSTTIVSGSQAMLLNLMDEVNYLMELYDQAAGHGISQYLIKSRTQKQVSVNPYDLQVIVARL